MILRGGEFSRLRTSVKGMPMIIAGSVRNFVFKAVLGILALPRQGKNP